MSPNKLKHKVHSLSLNLFKYIFYLVPYPIYYFYSLKMSMSSKHTQNLLVSKAHDLHGFHCFMEVVFVLLSRDGEVSIRQKTVFVESFQKQVS